MSNDHKTARKLGKGFYEFRGFTICLITDFGVIEWEITETNESGWSTIFPTLKASKNWINEEIKAQQGEKSHTGN